MVGVERRMPRPWSSSRDMISMWRWEDVRIIARRMQGNNLRMRPPPGIEKREEKGERRIAELTEENKNLKGGIEPTHQDADAKTPGIK